MYTQFRTDQSDFRLAISTEFIPMPNLKKSLEGQICSLLLFNIQLSGWHSFDTVSCSPHVSIYCLLHCPGSSHRSSPPPPLFPVLWGHAVGMPEQNRFGRISTAWQLILFTQPLRLKIVQHNERKGFFFQDWCKKFCHLATRLLFWEKKKGK